MTEVESPVTFEILVDIFRDPKFQRSLQELVSISHSDHMESDFSVYKDFFSDPYFIGGVYPGNSDGVSTIGSHYSEDNIPFDEFYRAVLVHSHSALSSCFPSLYDPITGRGDLAALNSDMVDHCASYTFLNRPLNVVCAGTVLGSMIDLFLIQQTSKNQLSETLLQDISDQISEGGLPKLRELSERELLARFNKSGFYRTAILTLTEDGFSEEDLMKLEQFKYSPKILSEE